MSYNSIIPQHNNSINSNNWLEVRKFKVDCPICGKPDWCCIAEDETAAMCRREEFNPSNRFELIKEDIDKNNEPYWIYKLKETRRESNVKDIKPVKKSKYYHGTPDYIYHDKDGEVLFGVVRVVKKDNKKFFQVRPDQDRWLWGLGDVEPVPYRLPEIKKAVLNGETVFIAEGEKDVKTLLELGFEATCNPMGAGKWRPEYSKHFNGADVVILGDMDKPGWEHVDKVARLLQGKANSIKIIKEWPGFEYQQKHGADVTDWIKYGGTKEELLQMVKDTEPEKEKFQIKKEQKKFKRTDAGNAERIVNLYGDDLRYCHDWGKWLYWDGTRWIVDKTGQTVNKALETVRAMYSEAAAAVDDEERKAIAKHAIKSESNNKIKAMLDLAKSMLPIMPDQLDQNKWLLTTKNGTLDLKEGCKIVEPKRKHFITKKIPIKYKKGAKCPKWLEFLNMIMANNQELVTFLQKAAGYSLTGITDERCLFILYGTGKNGKTTFIETMAKMLAGYAQRTPTQTLLSKRYDGIPNDIARLKGARFVYAAESKEGRSLSEELIKDLTGTDTISARFMRAEWFDFKPEFKLWLSTNHKPVIKGTDDAIWDRIRLIPFKVRIPKNKILPMSEVEAMFDAEMPGILNWALEGLEKWKTEGLEMPEAVKKATEGYRSEMDILSEFIEDCCIIENTAEATVKDLYNTYSEWCEKNGERGIGKRSFGSRIRERGFDQYQRPTGNRDKTWMGIGIKNEIRT